MVEIVAERQESFVALLRGRGERVVIAPGLDEDVARKILVKDFVPAGHLLAVLFQDRQNAFIEVRLQSRFIAEVLLLDERLDPGILLPVFVSDFVAANVQILIREQQGHLANQFVDEGVDSFVGWIQRRVINTERMNDVIWTGSAGEFGVSDEPRGASGLACRTRG